MGNFSDGLKFGVGAYLGWLVVKWGILILCLLTICATVTFYALSRMDPQDVKNVYRDQVTYKSNCAVRSRPSYQARRIGKAEAWKRLFVTEKKDGWLKVELPSGRKGWCGCVDRIIYNGATTGKTTVDI
jgi:hypothetical protein